LSSGNHLTDMCKAIYPLFFEEGHKNVLTKFNKDWTINVTFRVVTRFYYYHKMKNDPPPSGHVFNSLQPKKVLTKFQEDWTVNVLSKVHIIKNAPPPGGHVFQPTDFFLDFIPGDIIETTILTKFHEDRTMNVASRVLTRKIDLLPGGHRTINLASRVHNCKAILEKFTTTWRPCFIATATIFKLVHDIIKTNLLTKFHDDRTINVASRVKNAPPPRGHVFQPIRTIFKINGNNVASVNRANVDASQRTTKAITKAHHEHIAQNISRINLLTKFHKDRKINVASRVLTRKNAPPPCSHVFQPTGIIFELIQDIIGMNLLTKFHEDRTVNVVSRINLVTKFHEDWTINVASRVNKSSTKTIFQLIQDIIGTNLLTMFHDDRKINVTSRVLTKKIAQPPWWPYIIGMNLLIEFHEDRTINVASRVKNAPPLGGHVFQANVTIFKLVQDITKTNLLTKFHQDLTIHVASRVKNTPPPGGHVFQPTGINFELVQDIIGIKLLTKFHEDWTINVASRVKNAPPLGSHFHEDRKINVASRVLTRKNAPPPGGHVFQPTDINFELDRTINVASRVKNAPLFGSHVYQANVTIFELANVDIARRTTDKRRSQKLTMSTLCNKQTKTIFKLIQDIIGTNLLTKFHDDRKKMKNARPHRGHFHVDRTTNVASRVKNAPPLGIHVFQANKTIFELIQDINKTNFLTIFHEDWTINVASRVLTRHVFKPTGIIFELVQDIIGINLLTKINTNWTINVASRVHIWKNAPPLDSHVFQAKVTIFKLIQDIIGTNLLSKFHEYRQINVASRVITRKTAPPPGGHFFQPTGIIFELFQNIIEMNLLTKFHEDQTINVASRVLTRFYYSHIRKNAPPLGSHVFQANVTIFELIQDIIETNF
ncbi:hypothetical protein DPMN_122627, partial [Dreissena polymorpha]